MQLIYICSQQNISRGGLISTCLREKSEGVQNSCVERVAQMGRPVVERPFPRGGCLDCEAQERHHSKAGVLDLRQLEDGLLLWVGRQPQRVKVRPARVQPLLRVKLRIPLELNVPDHEHLDPDQRGDGEGERLPEVRRPVDELHLSFGRATKVPRQSNITN